jgi:curved DNA-binding protein CbpA
MNIKNYYSVLGINKTATEQDIKAAFKSLALKWHPDMRPPSRRRETHRRFIQINEAYETLIDKDKRQEYDLLYERHFEGGYMVMAHVLTGAGAIALIAISYTIPQPLGFAMGLVYIVSFSRIALKIKQFLYGIRIKS